MLDAEILADVYLAMTGGQSGLFEDQHSSLKTGAPSPSSAGSNANRPKLPVIAPTAEELAAHQAWLDELDKKSGGKCLWKQLEITTH